MVLMDGTGAVYRGHLGHVGSYPVGSGDAVLAALSLALVGGAMPEDALAAALGAGSANAELPGPGILDADRAQELAAASIVERVTL
jgi:fructose-1-phosphate kinase PfkB-like protein